jgi:hypothetical protein
MRCGRVLLPAKSTDDPKSEVTCLGCTMNLTLEQEEGAEVAAVGDPPV